MINLDEGEPVVIEIPAPLAVDQVKISSHVAHADCIVSVPVMKTHMYTIASLSLKNMKGCLYQRESNAFITSVRKSALPPGMLSRIWIGPLQISQAASTRISS